MPVLKHALYLYTVLPRTCPSCFCTCTMSLVRGTCTWSMHTSVYCTSSSLRDVPAASTVYSEPKRKATGRGIDGSVRRPVHTYMYVGDRAWMHVCTVSHRTCLAAGACETYRVQNVGRGLEVHQYEYASTGGLRCAASMVRSRQGICGRIGRTGRVAVGWLW